MSHRVETVIKPAGRATHFNWSELLEYRDLLYLMIRRDFVSRYKQTVLGPAWAIIQPVITSLVFTVIFGKVAKIPTDGAPPFLFYLTGMLFWQIFSGSVMSAGNSLQMNAAVFTKVYFPRIIPALATVISQLIPFVIQFTIFLGFYLWYILGSGEETPHWVRILWLPLLLTLVLTLSLGLSLAFSALTAKYRDLKHALGFLMQLGLYVTPVIYPASQVSETWRWLIWLNPMAAPVSASKWIFLDAGEFPTVPLAYSALICALLLIVALKYFQKIQRTFVDTV